MSHRPKSPSRDELRQWEVELPQGYRRADVLKFHSRDSAAIAEAVDGATLRKAVVLDAVPCLFEIEFKSTAAGQAGRAVCRLFADVAAEAPGMSCADAVEAKAKAGRRMLRPGIAEAAAGRMLGVATHSEHFEAAMRGHPLIAPLLNQQAGLAIPMAATPFEAITWAVTGQQINVAVATQLRRRLVQLAGLPHRSGLICYPDAARVAELTEKQLGEAKFSRAKAATLKRISDMVCSGELPLDSWLENGTPAEVIRERLLAISGIGPWTANYTLLRGFGSADCSLHGDAAVKNAIRRLLQQEGKVSNDQAEKWLLQFAPWRSWVAAHLWAMR